MVVAFETLLRVQELDTTLDQLRHRRQTLPARVERADVERARASTDRALAELQVLIDDLQSRQATLEEQTAACAQRRHVIEERMRSGAVTAAKDLQAMDAEVHQLEERQARLEEEEILLLEEEEPLDLQQAELQGERASQEAELARLDSIILVADEELVTEISRVEAERSSVALTLPQDLGERYERLRAQLGGVGAATLEANRCTGCHLTLSSGELDRLHHLSEDEVATCPQCDRILVH